MQALSGTAQVALCLLNRFIEDIARLLNFLQFFTLIPPLKCVTKLISGKSGILLRLCPRCQAIFDFVVPIAKTPDGRSQLILDTEQFTCK